MKQETDWVLKKPLFVDKKDRRYRKYQRQLQQRGFSDEETWNIDNTVSAFILPRLKRFREINNGYPQGLSEKKWNQIVDKMIFAFEWNLGQFRGITDELTQAEIATGWKKYEEGLALFAKHLRDLWW